MKKFRKVLSLTVATLLCLNLSLNAFASVNYVVDWTSDCGAGQAHGKSSGSGPISSRGSQGTTSGSYNFNNGGLHITINWNTSPRNSGFNNIQGGGWKIGTNNRVINYNVGSYNFTSGGDGYAYFSVYGWTKSPLIEYYVIDTWNNFSNNIGNRIGGSFSSDGGTYNAYWENVNGPNIMGSGPFKRIKSVRTAQKPRGNNERITFLNHVNFWNSNGHPLGSHADQTFALEGYNSSGNASFSIW